MANKKISGLDAYTTPLSADLLPIVDTANTTTKKVTIANFFNILSSLFTIKDSSDTSKKVAFNVSGVTTGTTRTLTIPNADVTIVGLDTTQTLTNKTIGSGTKIAVGAETTGAIYYKDSSGNLTPLTIGSAGQILDVSAGGLPEWIANPSAADASTTVKGVVETATAAEITAGTATGGTGAKLAITPDQLALSTPVFNGSGLTNIQAVSRISAVPPVSLVSSTSLTDLLSVSIPANTLGTANIVRFKIPIWKISKAGTGAASSLLIKLGGTTLVNINPDNNALTYTNNVGYIEGFLCGNGATNSQLIWYHYVIQTSNTTSTTDAVIQSVGSGTSAEDSTGALTLKVQWQNGTNSANDYIYTTPSIIEKIS